MIDQQQAQERNSLPEAAVEAREVDKNYDDEIDLDLLPKRLASFFLKEGSEEDDYRSSSRLAYRVLGEKDHDNKHGDESQNQQRKNMMNSTLTLKINVESFRFVAYCLFWLMCIIASLLTKYVAAPRLLEGPSSYKNGIFGDSPLDSDNSAYPPFEGNRSDGFDIKTESHLVEAFGFNNVSSI